MGVSIQGEGGGIGRAFAAAIAGALLGPVLGGVASLAGTGWTFGAVAAASVGLAVWALLTPASRPEKPQPLSMVVAALRDRRVQLSVWFVLLPALLFGTLAVLGPLRLSALGFGAVGIGAVWLSAGLLETANNVLVGRLSDRLGPMAPIRVALIGTIVGTILLPWPQSAYVLAVVIVASALAFGTFYTPGMALLSEAAFDRGLDYGYAFALLNLAWAPGQSIGAALGGTVAEATSDAVPYLALSALSIVTLVGVRRLRSAAVPGR